MNSRIGWVLVVVGVVLAVGTGGLVFLLLRQQEARALERARAETQAVAAPVTATMKLPVAARPIAPGAVISGEDILLKDFPLDLVPVAAITETLILENQVAATAIGQGETISTRQLAGPAALEVSQQAPAGRVIFAYPIADLLTSSDIVRDGDRIDLLITMAISSTDTSGSATFFTLQNIEVFRVLREVGPPAEDGQAVQAGPPTALLLALTPEDAVIIKHVKDSGGVIDFVLRSISDNEPFTAPVIDNDEIIERYAR